jgi:hypothetical protein
VRECPVASVVAVAIALVVSSCEREETSAPVSPSPSANIAVAPSAPKPPEKPWFVGTWTAVVTTKPHRIDLDRKSGAPREWVDETREPQGIGEMKLSIDVDDSGAVTGTGTGALGNVSILGTVQDDGLRARMVPIDPEAFGGTLVADHEGDTLEGTLNASSRDSLSITKTPVLFKKAGAK